MWEKIRNEGNIMGYDILMIDKKTGEIAELPDTHHIKGGTYAVGGTNEAWLSITYNYSKFFKKYIDQEKGIRWLYGKKGKRTIKRLRKAIEEMKDNATLDYWEATEGNARLMLKGLLFFAEKLPNCIWKGD